MSMLTWNPLMVPFKRKVSGAECPDRAWKLSWAGGGSLSNSSVGEGDRETTSGVN